MNRTSFSIILLFSLIIALNLDSWIGQENDQNTEDEIESFQRPAYQAYAMHSYRYDIEGNLTQEVYAQEMESYEELGFTVFKQPRYVIYTQNRETPWQISALEGTLKQQETLTLERGVIIQSTDAKGFVKTMQTNFITLNLENKTLTTDEHIVITGNNFIVEGEGVKANLDTNQFEISHHVRSTFNPQSTH